MRWWVKICQFYMHACRRRLLKLCRITDFTCTPVEVDPLNYVGLQVWVLTVYGRIIIAITLLTRLLIILWHVFIQVTVAVIDVGFTKRSRLKACSKNLVSRTLADSRTRPSIGSLARLHSTWVTWQTGSTIVPVQAPVRADPLVRTDLVRTATMCQHTGSKLCDFVLNGHFIV